MGRMSTAARSVAALRTRVGALIAVDRENRMRSGKRFRCCCGAFGGIARRRRTQLLREAREFVDREFRKDRGLRMEIEIDGAGHVARFGGDGADR